MATISFEAKQKAEDALAWALSFIGKGTHWHEVHYGALREALDAADVAPPVATKAESAAPTTPTSGELVTTGVEDDGLDALTVAQLTQLADEEKVELPTGAKKADIVSAIRSAKRAQ